MARILLVTAAQGLSAVVTRLFERRGASVETVSSVAAGAQALTDQPGRFHHVVLDATLTRSVRTAELADIHASGVPLIVLFSEDDFHRLRRLFPAGTADFLKKPFRPSSLLQFADSGIDPA